MSLESFLTRLLEYQGPIYLIAAISSLLFALMVYLLHRKVKILHKKNWILPFAHTFLVLALIYFVRLFKFSQYGNEKLGTTHPISLFISLCSGLTNYWLLLAAFHLARPALHERITRLLGKLHIGRTYTKHAALMFICLASLLRVWTQIPDTILSFFSLTVAGYILYQNISYRRDKLMAWVALLSSIGYAFFYFLRDFAGDSFVQSNLPSGLPGNIDENVMGITAYLLFSIPFFIFRFGVFLSAYSLMLILSAPFEGIEEFVKRVNEEKKEFLENNGIVRSIYDELHFGSVKLIIKLPGLKDNKIAIYSFPPSGPGPRHGPRIEDYEEDTDYDRVMKSGKSHINPREGYPYWFIRRIADATVPIHFHESVIACLYAKRGEGKFTEADLSILERIASMIAPTVQIYREMSAINKFNQDGSERQIKVDEYEMDRDIEGITESIHNIIAPLAMRLSIEAGFLEHSIAYPRDGEFTELVKQQLKAGPKDEDFVDREKNRWLKLGLKIPYESTLDKTPGEQNLGKLLFLAESERKINSEVTVGTNPVFCQVLSDLMADILLDFIRGYLSCLTDDLGVALSGLKETEFEGWYKEVRARAHKAGLCWVVAKVPDGQIWLGEENARELVRKIKNSELKANRQEKTKKLRLYSLNEAQDGVWHVIRFCEDSKESEDSKAVFWFGVARREFGEELSYVSPWRYFLEHFCEIAHSALLRVQRLIREESERRDLEWIYSLSGATLDLGNSRHSFINEINSLVLSLQGFINAISENGLQVNDKVKGWLNRLMSKCTRAEDEFKSFTSTLERYRTNPCSLDDAVSEACDKLKTPLEELDIKLEKHYFPPEVEVPEVKVPYGVALYVVRTILDNAKDAFRDELRADGKNKIRTIDIVLRPTSKKVICDIVDNGPGIDKDVLTKLFIDVAISPKENSHGHGLLTSRIHLRMFGGYISTLEQEPKRKGAAFRIEFPV
jgi:signal transduction histidine kinase